MTYAEKILKSEAPIDWSLPAAAVARPHPRLQPVSVCHGCLQRRNRQKSAMPWPLTLPAHPVKFLEAGHRLVVACGSGAIDCLELQRAGKPAMPAAAFVQSTGLTVGDKLQ